MKISKRAVLTLWIMFSVASLWLILVNASDVEISVNPSNAIQHMNNVIFISTWDSAFAKMNNKNGLVRIETKGNFILSKTWDDEVNMVLRGGENSILWWINNKINNGISGYSVILAWSGNVIYTDMGTSSYDVIVWWEWNNITGSTSIIVWGNNMVRGHYSVVAWNDTYVMWDRSVVLGSWARVKANNTFLWTDSEDSIEVEANDVFVVDASSGMVVDGDSAHSFAKLTLGWPLSVFSNVDDENIQCGMSDGELVGWWTLKVVTTDTNQMCLCSCNGSGWNPMFARGKCLGACNSDMKPKCGDTVGRVCNSGGVTYLWSCEKWNPIDGEGSYLVDKNNKIHWTCQGDDGSVEFCSGTVSSDAIECVFDCVWNLPNNAHTNNGMTITNKVDIPYSYNPTWTGDCLYSCDSGFDYIMDGSEVRCVKCKEGTYDPVLKTCAEEAVCEDDLVPYNGECISLGECTDKSLNFYLTNFEQYTGSSAVNWYDRSSNYFRPYGQQVKKPWICKSSSGEVNPHACEFSCNSSHKCAYELGWWTCIKKDAIQCLWYSARYQENQSALVEHPQFWHWRWHHPTVANAGPDIQYYEYVDSLEELYSKQSNNATWCYYTCEKGWHYDGSTPPKNWHCVSNCKDMSLGAAFPHRYYSSSVGVFYKFGPWWKDVHFYNDMRWAGVNYTWYFYNWKFDWTWVRWNWRYLSSWEFDDRVRNESWTCLWTCRTWIPLTGLRYKSQFREYFSYDSRPGDYYNVCWEKCATGYYFSGIACVETSLGYKVDESKPITYAGITNYAGQVSACPPNHRYNVEHGSCSPDPSPSTCEEWYIKIDGMCNICPYWEGFTGDGADVHCVEYDRCDLNKDWSVDASDANYLVNYALNSNNHYDAWLDVDGDWVVEISDVTALRDRCTLSYDKCDVNHDMVVDDADVELLNRCIDENDSWLGWCDVNRDNQVDSADLEYFKEGGECYLW